MARPIDADALRDYVMDVYGGNGDNTVVWFGDIVDFIDSFPTVDAVSVRRCKDCDMWNEEDFSGKKSLGNYRCACAKWSNMEDGRRIYTGPDDFCSYGERKGGNE